MIDNPRASASVHKTVPMSNRLLSSAAQLAFVLVGGVLTLVAFLTLNVFVQDVVSKEYDRVSENTAEILVDELVSLEKSIESIATMLNFALTTNNSEILSSINDLDTYFDNFQQIVVASRTAEDQWRFQKLPISKSEDQLYGTFAIATDPETNIKLLSHLIKNRYFIGDSAKILMEPEFFKSVSDTEANDNARPFALIMPLKPGDPHAGFVIAVTHAGFSVSPTWFENNALISSIKIRDITQGTDIFTLSKTVDEGQKISQQMRDFEFELGGKKFEIRTEFIKEEKIFFLETLPYFVIVFGLLLTVVGMLYLHTHQRQSRHVAKMNETLEEKNRELEEEVFKRARLNKALRKSERENRAIVDAVSDIIFETDTSGKFLFLNSTWQKITGFDPEQSRGLDFVKMLHPEDQEKNKRDFQLLVRGKKNAYRSFTRLRTSDGTFRAVELAVSMIRQDESKNLRVVGTFTDVEERRRAERALSEAEKKYRTIVENAAGGIFQLTPEGLYLSANPALSRILGYDSAEAILREIKNANDEVYTNQRERQRLMKELNTRNVLNNYEVQVCRKDGIKIWVNENIRVVRDESGNVLYYEGSMEDITQRKESEMALREAKIRSDLANRAKSEFLANMSHELRTPLNSIIGFSEIIKNEAFGAIEQEAYKEYSKDIYYSGKKLLDVINEILDISKIEAGERQLNESMVDISKVVTASLNLLDTKAKANKLIVDNQIDEKIFVIGEELAIKQIIINLLSNAIKFTPAGGRVTISKEVNSDRQFCVSISDTGIGLDPSEIEKALSPFGQVDSAMNRNNAGTGLGLTLVDALVKLHGGKLELFSQKGLGTTATVIFPADRLAVKRESNQKIEHKPETSTTDKSETV
jgi:PAS domain S-box-containing protein